MAQMLEIQGLARLRKQLLNQIAKKRKQLTIGLKRCGLLLQRTSQQIVPVDTGNLKNSAFTVASKEGTDSPEVRVGFTATYALYVHENLDASHKPGKEAKFLERPLREKRKEMVEILKEAMK